MWEPWRIGKMSEFDFESRVIQKEKEGSPM